MTDSDKQNKILELQEWIHDHTPESLNVLIPLSGGSDSALSFWLYNKVVPEKTLGIYVGTTLRQAPWFNQVGTIHIEPNLLDAFHDMEITRWGYFLKRSITDKRILVSNRNKTEHTLGSFSHASRVATHLPIVNLWKSEILELCDFIGVPKEIIDSSRQADPSCGRTEEYASVPIETIDRFLQLKEFGVSDTVIIDEVGEVVFSFLKAEYTKNHYKRSLPVI